MVVLIVIYMLILVIFGLVTYAVMQIKLFGMKVKDFGSIPYLSKSSSGLSAQIGSSFMRTSTRPLS